MGQRILITGGAGFVGSSLALNFKRDNSDAEVIALDNLSRRGSELSLPRLAAGGVAFCRGDVRREADLDAVGPVDLIVECSAEPSVHAGYDESPRYLIDTNLVGAVNCLEYARRLGGDLVFISTSRVYPIEPLRAIPLQRRGDRLAVAAGANGLGWSGRGISEDFPLDGGRSLYGTTKLCAELLITEYRDMYGLRAIIDRCGVLTGPWQMGKVDQGVVVLWMAAHVFEGRLDYRGFGGEGLQVRDILHVADLYDLLVRQIARIDNQAGRVYNVGGGPETSVSLRELTEYCVELAGRRIDIGAVPETRAADVPYYVSDTAAVGAATGWEPTRSVGETLAEIHAWLVEHRDSLEPVLAGR
jgi:CDP-paratose 2-epimerase